LPHARFSRRRRSAILSIAPVSLLDQSRLRLIDRIIDGRRAAPPSTGSGIDDRTVRHAGFSDKKRWFRQDCVTLRRQRFRGP
jgi:hypothetical protein